MPPDKSSYVVLTHNRRYKDCGCCKKLTLRPRRWTPCHGYVCRQCERKLGPFAWSCKRCVRTVRCGNVVYYVAKRKREPLRRAQ